MEVSSAQTITVAPLDGDEDIWQTFLAGSANGTLFHDLDFLRYHPKDRFHFHHLVLRRNGKPAALLPGGLVEADGRTMFCSPLGASIGGFAVGTKLGAELALSLVESLQNYANERGWAGIEITLPPSCYSFETAGLLEFALFSRGFRIVHRWLCSMLALNGGSQNAFEQVYIGRQITSVRAARRKGMVGIETGIEGLDNFLKVFRDTYDRHGVAATHTPDEIRDLLQRLPDRVRIHLAMLGEAPSRGLAGLSAHRCRCQHFLYLFEHGACR